MLKQFVLSALLTASGMLFAQSTLSANAPQDNPIGVADGEQHQKLLKAIAPYIQQAKNTWPAAKAKYLKGLPLNNVFFITAELVDMSGKREMVFIRVEQIDNGVIAGLIANDINTVVGFRLGQKYTIAESNIWDWTISKPDGSEEGNLVGKFLDTYVP